MSDSWQILAAKVMSNDASFVVKESVHVLLLGITINRYLSFKTHREFMSEGEQINQMFIGV